MLYFAEYQIIKYFSVTACIGVSLFLTKFPLKSANCPSPPLSGNPLFYIGFPSTPLKV